MGIVIKEIKTQKISIDKPVDEYKVFVILEPYIKEDPNLYLEVYVEGRKFEMRFDSISKLYVSTSTIRPLFLSGNTEKIFIDVTLFRKEIDFPNPTEIDCKSIEITLQKNNVPITNTLISKPVEKLKIILVKGPYNKNGELLARVESGYTFNYIAIPSQKSDVNELKKTKWGIIINNNKFVEVNNQNQNIIDGIIHNVIKFETKETIVKVQVFAYITSRSNNVVATWIKKPNIDRNLLYASKGLKEDKKSDLDIFIEDKLKKLNNLIFGDDKNEGVNESNVQSSSNNNTICINEARIRAFMRMLRKGEGTDNEKGYTTLYSGKQFTDLSKHPEIVIKSGNYSSSAAGAYQIMRYTWWWLNGEDLTKDLKKAGKYNELHDYVKKYNIIDFKPESQDKLCIILFRHKQNKKFLDLIIDNKPKEAMENFGSYEWASLPPGRYGQPTQTMNDALNYYEKCLKDELLGISNLHLKKGFLKEFGYDICNDSNKSLNKSIIDSINNSIKLSVNDIDLRDKMTFYPQKSSTDCNIQCRKIMATLKVVPESPSELNNESFYQTAIESNDHKKLIYNIEDFKNGLIYINKSLEAGYPIMVGVNHTLKYGYNEKIDTTDHYVIIVGRIVEENTVKYRFWDVATIRGAEGDFKFTLSKDKLTSTKVWKSGRIYTVTQIRRNLDEKGKIINY